MNTLTFLTGKVYPDRTFTIGMVPKKQARSQDRQYERAFRAQPETDYGKLADWYEGTNTIAGEHCYLRDRPLFIKGLKSSRKKRGSYGKHGITSFGRKVVKNGALLLEKKYGKSRLGFVTCTLPTYSEELQRAINGSWGEVVRRFYQKITRQLQKIGKPSIYVSVTEIQEKRFNKLGLPCPHLHFVYVCKDMANSRYWLYICQIHRAWNQSLREVIEHCGFSPQLYADNNYGSVHAACVRKSASAYLGKYMSKGCGVIATMQEKGWNEFPKQWWTACTYVKKLFKDSIIRMDANMAGDIFYRLADYLHDGIVEWAMFVDICVENGYYCVGVVGTLSYQAYKSLEET